MTTESKCVHDILLNCIVFFIFSKNAANIKHSIDNVAQFDIILLKGSGQYGTNNIKRKTRQ